MQNDTIEIIQENPMVEEKLKLALAGKKKLETERLKVQFNIEHAEKRMSQIAEILKDKYDLSIDDIPAFLNKAIPEKEQAVNEFHTAVQNAIKFYDENLKTQG